MTRPKKGSRWAADMPATEPEFLWHRRLPVGHMSVIAGAPGIGKSTLGYRIAADVDMPTLFVTTEEVDKSVWRPRLEAAGVDPAKAWHQPEVRFSREPADLDYLAELIRLYDIRLIMVDPVQNHLRVNVSHDQAVRAAFEPYMELIEEARIALVLQAHVLRRVNANADPQLAFPAGLGGSAKTAYLFAMDPTLGADADLRILATAKFNFGKGPESRRFEFATGKVSVRGLSGRRVNRDFGFWIDRGDVQISAKMLLPMLAPETKERKSDKVSHLLIQLLKGGPQPVALVKQAIKDEEPLIGERTVQRVVEELGLEVLDDQHDARKKWWKLPDSILAVVEEMTEPEDELIIEEIEIPDAPPEDWDGDEAEDGS